MAQRISSRGSKSCLRDTYLESYITTFTNTRRETPYIATVLPTVGTNRWFFTGRPRNPFGVRRADQIGNTVLLASCPLQSKNETTPKVLRKNNSVENNLKKMRTTQTLFRTTCVVRTTCISRITLPGPCRRSPAQSAEPPPRSPDAPRTPASVFISHKVRIKGVQKANFPTKPST